MAIFQQMCIVAILLMLLGILLVGHEFGVVLHQNPVAAIPVKQYRRAVEKLSTYTEDIKTREPSPISRSLKQLRTENLEGTNCTPFDRKVFTEKPERSKSKQNLEFMCVNETELWNEILRNRTLVKLKQSDGRSALVKAVLNNLNRVGINSDRQFEGYLQRFSLEEKKRPKVNAGKAYAVQPLSNLHDANSLAVRSAVDYQAMKFPVKNLPGEPVLPILDQNSKDKVHHHAMQGYNQWRDNVDVDDDPQTYKLPNYQIPKYLPNPEHFQHSEDENIEKEDFDYLRDNENDENAAIDLKGPPQQIWPVFNMAQYNSNKGPQSWIRPRDINNAARLAHPQGMPQLNNADLHRYFDRKLNGANVQMNPSLVQLRNLELPPNPDLHRSRNFPSSHNFSGLTDYMKYLDIAANISMPKYRSAAQHSLNPDLLLRSRFQQKQMREFCLENRLTSRLPSNTEDLDTLFQHLLYDDSKRIVYCYAPKNGCSNMKRTLLILNGILPPESVAKRPPEAKLKEVYSFRNLSKDEALYRLENYLKFTIVRNPIERLLSAYMNKIAPPLRIELRAHFPDKVKAYILKRYRTSQFVEWLDNNNGSAKIMPTFQEFLRFMAQFPFSLYNEHFMPVLNLCYPCAVQYDLYLNFKSLNYDVYALMDYLDIPKRYYPNAISHKSTPTSVHLNEYFATVTKGARERLFRVFTKELRFYYAIHPEEWYMHRQLMYVSAPN